MTTFDRAWKIVLFFKDHGARFENYQNASAMVETHIHDAVSDASLTDEKIKFMENLVAKAKAEAYEDARKQEIIRSAESERRAIERCQQVVKEQVYLAYETAAQVVDHMYYVQPYEIAIAIRALKEEKS